MTAPLSILVLAAGEGTRMKSRLPKVLHPVGERPLLEHVLTAAYGLKPKSLAIVVGHAREQVKETLARDGWKQIDFIVQEKPRGSGDAVLKARPWLKSRRGTLLVVYGDTPLLTAQTLKKLCAQHAADGHAATFLAMDIAEPAGYGRMILDSAGLLERIVEERDADDGEKAVTLVNSGVACWDIAALLEVLPELKNDNAKHEYYLTDAVGLLRQHQKPVGVVRAEDPEETHGVNTRIDLAKAEAAARRRILDHWMREGVTIVDPATTYISADAVLSADTRLWPGTLIQGKSHIGPDCEIGPYTIIESAVVKAGAKIGPFARLRPGTVIEETAHIGNFVEVKKSRIGKGSKANHLTYIGDSQIGSGVNVGAGTITCNYDGMAKHATIIADGVFVGSNTNLVAPVKIGRGSVIAAGSTITQDVPADALALARSQQTNKAGWAKAWRRAHKKGKPS